MDRTTMLIVCLFGSILIIAGVLFLYNYFINKALERDIDKGIIKLEEFMRKWNIEKLEVKL